jgi:AraC-like DNA-binding protein
MQEGGGSRGFFRPQRALSSVIDFGFVLPEYRYRDGRQVQRVPVTRTTLYYATDVRRHGSQSTITGLFCEGPHSRAFGTQGECGEMVAVKVRTGGAAALLGIPAKEIRNQTCSLEDLWGRDAALLADRMLNVATTAERVALLQQELVRRYQRHGGHDPVALTASNVIERSEGRLRVTDLIDRSGYSQRTFLQRFDQWVGLTPKQLARVVRMRATIARLACGWGADWAKLARQSGFADQAHMIHEFQALIGHSPSHFVEQRTAFSPVGAPASGRGVLPEREQRLYQVVGMVSRWVSS